eukprot:15326647-Ditylum_brightwellii.AAC.1
MTETVAGAIEGMGKIVLPKVDAVTVVLNGSGTVVPLRFNGHIMTFDLRMMSLEELVMIKDQGLIENLPEEDILSNPVVKLRKIGNDKNWKELLTFPSEV